jgi:hypothetical protein
MERCFYRIVSKTGKDYGVFVVVYFFLTASWFENMQAPGTVLMVSGAFLYSLGGCDGDEIVCRKFAL